MITARHQDVFLGEVFGEELILGVIPEPGEFTTGVLVVVVSTESFVGREDVFRDVEVVWRGTERPEVRAEDHDGEGNVHIVLRLLHFFFELVREILAQGHI